MVNKRFNKKFRRALGAVLGALSVASISNIDVINATLYNEHTLENDHDVGFFFTMSKNDKAAIFAKAEELYNNRKFGKPESATGIVNLPDAVINCEVSFPLPHNGRGEWKSAYSVTIEPHLVRSVRVTILQSQKTDGSDYLLAPVLSEDVYWDYITTHEVPWVGSWLEKAEKCVPNNDELNTRYMRALNDTGPIKNPNYVTKNLYERQYDGVPRSDLPGWWAPDYEPRIPAPPGALGFEDKILTRWADLGLTDVSLWNEQLKGLEHKNKMYYEPNICPPELRSFYFPEEKKEDTTLYSTSSNTPNQPVSSNMTTLTPAMTAMLAAPAVAMATNQPVPTPAHVVANNNVTPGSNNLGAAPAAQNGSVSSGSTDVGPTSQAGSDVKPTSVQHDVKPSVDSKESRGPIRS